MAFVPKEITVFRCDQREKVTGSRIFLDCLNGSVLVGIDQFGFKNSYIASSAISGGLPRAWQKMSILKLCTALVQEQVYAWGIASSFVCLGSPPGMADAMLLKPNWSIGIGLLSFNKRNRAKLMLQIIIGRCNKYISEDLLARAYRLHVVNLFFHQYNWSLAPPPPPLPNTKELAMLPLAHLVPLIWLAIGTSTNLVEKARYTREKMLPQLESSKL